MKQKPQNPYTNIELELLPPDRANVVMGEAIGWEACVDAMDSYYKSLTPERARGELYDIPLDFQRSDEEGRMKYEITSAREGETLKLLEEGWEPFAVVPQIMSHYYNGMQLQITTTIFIWFRRAKQ